jgi:hypothetical protein
MVLFSTSNTISSAIFEGCPTRFAGPPAYRLGAILSRVLAQFKWAMAQIAI